MKPCRPNILWIYCDELRTDALSCYGSPSDAIQTPHLDNLAQQGTLFENCFCNSPVCVPSRTSTLTGLEPQHTGVYHNEACWPLYELPNDVTTFPEVFAAAGYRTVNFGKVHVPHGLQAWQQSDGRGGGMNELIKAADPDAKIAPSGVPTYIGGRMKPGLPYPPDAVFDNAEQWLADEAGDADLGQPWFMRVSVLQPHTPVVPPERWAGRYAGLFDGGSQPRLDASKFERRFAEVLGGAEMSREDIAAAQQCYYELVGWIDERVGTLLAALDRTGQRDNTIIVFDADHGAALGEGGRWAKHVFAPEVHRVPRIVSWPDAVSQGHRVTDVTQSIDMAQTLAQLCDVALPAQFRGHDALAGDEVAEDRARPDEREDDSQPGTDGAVVSVIGFGHRLSTAFPNLGAGKWSDTQGWPRRACIRTARYRLDMNVLQDDGPVAPEDEDVYLADVQPDPGELTNLANDPAYAEVREGLRARLLASVRDAVESPSIDAVCERMEKVRAGEKV